MDKQYKKLLADSHSQNERVRESLKKYLEENPIEGAHKKIVFTNIEAKAPKDSYKNIQEAIMKKKSITGKMYATAHVVNKRTGNVEDSKKVLLGSYLHKNPLGTYIVEGSHYIIPHQFRLKPSGYTMLKNNGDVETLFNTAGGPPMKVALPQNKNDISMKIGSRKFNPYDVMRIMGASDEELKKKLGSKIYDVLKTKSNIDKTAKSLAEVTNVVTPDKATTEPGLELLKKELTVGKVDKEATKTLLDVDTDHMNHDMIINSIKKAVKVKKGEADGDDKENLAFKKVIPPEELIAEGVRKNLQAELWKKRAPLNTLFHTKVDKVWDEPLLNKASKRFITTSAISRMPEGYNPLQLKQINADVTPLGEGGVKSAEVITPSMRGLHLSQAGFIDPIKSPEGANTGITLSLTEGAYVDKDNNPAIKVKNLKTKKTEVVPLKELWNKKLAFPDVDNKGKVGIRHKNKLYEGNISKADYQIINQSELYGPAMNSIGALSTNDPTRNLMASKHILQALPLKDRDIPNVMVADEGGEPGVAKYAKDHLPIADTKGVITKIDPKEMEIHIKDEKGKIHKIPYSATKTPLNVKTYIKHTPIVGIGDKVKEGQPLADSNYTRKGIFALGKNLKTAFMMYPGTRNDAFVASASAAKKMTSLQSASTEVDKGKHIEFNKRKFVTMFPDIAKKIDLNKYDEKGFLKPGHPINKGEPIYLGIKKLDSDEIKFANDKVKKLLYGGYAPMMEEWKYDHPAKLDKIDDKRSHVKMLLTYKAPLAVGDKIAGRSGNKGIISKIIPDDEMPRTEDGKPIDVIMGGAGIASRQNPAQVIEATLGAVVKKTGKPYVLPHHTDVDLSEFAKNEAKKHGVKLYHKIYDPMRKIWLKQPVFVGDYHIQKLFKTGDSAYSAVGYGAVDGIDQPKKGGKTSASSISNMEVNALLAHGAKDFLREAFTIRSQKNKDWFNAYMNGSSILPAPEDKTSLVKFKGLLNQMHMKVVDDGKNLKVLPMTDKDVVKLSNGEVKEPYGLAQGSLNHIKKGFYDPHIFGGNGNYYGHIDLGTKVINPNYKEFIARSLGYSPKKLDEMVGQNKIGEIEKAVNKLNLGKLETKLKHEIKKTNNSSIINQHVKLIKAIKKIKENNIPLSDVAFMSKVPVLPTKYRPVSKMPNGTIVDHDINNHYAEIIDAANTLKKAKAQYGQNHPLTQALRTELQNHIGAMYGVNESPNPTFKRKGIKSVQEYISGAKPKESFWQKNVLQNKVFSSGRAVIIPKEKYLGMDEVELPKNVAWKIFEPHVKRKMAQAGMDSTSILTHIEDKTDTAKRFLDQTMKEVPIVINRAPSLHRHNMTGHYAKISPDNAMRISPLIENPQNADYDGDQLAIHAPLTQKSIDDVKNKIMASKQLFGSRNNDNLQMSIDLDPHIGFFHATKYNNKNSPSANATN